MINNRPLVSVLLPTYARNANGLLAKAIRSVLQQTYTHYELLVIDDCSSDGSADTIAAYCKEDSRVKHIRLEKHVGLPAMSTAYGFLQSTGEYIAWQFDDCEWKPDHLDTLLNKMHENPSYGIVYGKCLCILDDESGTLEVGTPLNKSQLDAGNNHIPNVATLIPRAVYDEIGWVDPSIILKRYNDLDMWRRITNKYTVGFCDKIIAVEKGISLPDSLGQSVSSSPELVIAYMNSERNNYLQLSNVESWNPYLYAPQNETDTVQYLKVSIEHILRTKKYSDFTHIEKCWKNIIPHLPSDIEPSLIGCITWYHQDYANEIKKENRDIKRRMISMNNHMQSQQYYIDKCLAIKIALKLSRIRKLFKKEL